MTKLTDNLEKHNEVFQQLYGDINGFVISIEARRDNDSSDYTYGEVEFDSFTELLSKCDPAPGTSTVFYDLGCGTGKAVIAAMIAFDLKKSCGIEIIAPLCVCAEQQQQRLRANKAYEKMADRIEFKQGSFLEMDFSDADLIFINSTAFLDETWVTLTKWLEQTKPGTVIISLTKSLDSPHFQLNHSGPVKMSWGTSTAHIQKRL